MISNKENSSVKQSKKDIFTYFKEKLAKNQIFITIIAFLYILPLFTNSQFSDTRSTLSLFTTFLIFGIFALSFDFQLGRAGLLNFGQAAFFGLGAYVTMWHFKPSVFSHIEIPYTGILISDILGLVPFPFILISATFFGVLLGFIMGSTTNRMKGTAFAFIALAIAMLMLELIDMPINLPISGGESGLRMDIPPFMTNYIIYLLFVIITMILLTLLFIVIFIDFKERQHIFLLDFSRNKLANEYKEESEINKLKILLALATTLISAGILLLVIVPNILNMYFFAKDFIFKIPIQYYFVLTVTVFVYLFVQRVVNSTYGKALTAIAQNPDRMEALGYNVFYYKILAVGISGGLAGLAGSLYTTTALVIGTSSTFGILQTIDIMLYTITGGLGTLLGPFLGTIIVSFSEQRLVTFLESFNIAGEWWLVILGVAFILIILFFPYGIVGSIKIRAVSIKNNLRNWFGIRDSDYWWITLVLLILVFNLMIFL